MSRRVFAFVALLGALLLFAGCASEPTVELTAADAAVNAAVTAEAETYAPDQYRQAKDLLDEAKTAIQAERDKFALFRDFEPAKAKLVQVKQQADAAAEAAKQEKERVRQEVEQALADAETALTGAQEALDKAPKGKGTKADLEALKADLDAVRTGLAGAREAFNSGKYMDAKGRVASVKSQADSVLAQIQEAVAKKGRR